jgi:hypothetical protein
VIARSAWFLAGVGAGAYAAFKARRVADELSPEGLHERAMAMRVGARVVREQMEQARVDAEIDLRARFGQTPDRGVAAQSVTAYALTEDDD